MNKQFFHLFLIVLCFSATISRGATYYMSPNGRDSDPGTRSQPWGSFNRAWQSLYAGDVLVLLDGVYRQSLNPKRRNGRAGNPITIRAENDGAVLIDGDLNGDGTGDILPVKIGDTWEGEQGENPVGDYYVVEGIVAANSNDWVWQISGNHNVFRRISGYNANTNGNSHVIGIIGNYNLVEDAVASGSGRKMFEIFHGHDNTYRRCFAFWRRWDGRNWHDHWPWGDGVEVYNGSFNSFENVISVGHFDSIGLLSQNTLVEGNQILGSISISGGTDQLGNLFNWGSIRPQPSSAAPASFVSNPGWSSRNGFTIRASGEFRDNLLQDVLATRNAGLGVEVNIRSADFGETATNNRINRATFADNGHAYNGADARPADLAQLDSVTASHIEVIKDQWDRSSPSLTGEGARLRHRYVEGVLKDGSDGSDAQSLWPWPMEDRIRAEIGVSVTNLIAGIIPEQVAPITPPNKGSLAVSPVYLPFGVVEGTAPATREVVLKNIGNASITVTGDSFASGSGSAFSVATGTCPGFPFSLGASQSCTVRVSFAPGAGTPQTGDLAFKSVGAPPFPFPPTVYLSGISRIVPDRIPLPGRLEVEQYSGSAGSFQVTVTGDNGGGLKIGGITPGAEARFVIDAQTAGTYDITARVASLDNTSSKKVTVMIDGKSTATLSPVFTGGWEQFTDITVEGVSLSKGQHDLTLKFEIGGYDINYLDFELSDGAAPASPRNLRVTEEN